MKVSEKKITDHPRLKPRVRSTSVNIMCIHVPRSGMQFADPASLSLHNNLRFFAAKHKTEVSFVETLQYQKAKCAETIN